MGNFIPAPTNTAITSRLSYDDVLLVKRYFCVSAQAMLRTLRDLALISAAQSAFLLSTEELKHGPA